MDYKFLEMLTDMQFEELQKKAPENYECNCRIEGKTYDKDDEQCKKCYAACRLKDQLVEGAMKAGRIDVAFALMLAGGHGSDE